MSEERGRSMPGCPGREPKKQLAAAGAAAMDAERVWQQQRIDQVVAARARP